MFQLKKQLFLAQEFFKITLITLSLCELTHQLNVHIHFHLLSRLNRLWAIF